MAGRDRLPTLREGAMRIYESRAFAQREVRFFLRRLILLSVALTLLNCLGASLYAMFEDESWWQGLQRAIDTIATVGSIPAPHTLGGEITKLVLITLGLGTLFYVLVTATELFVAGELSGLVEARRMQSKIAAMSNHFLICGFGRVGRQVAHDLSEAGVAFVVVDDNPDVREEIESLNLLHIDGSGSDDEILRQAGIDKACAVIACVDSDAENIFITLTARGMRPDIEIVARAAQESSEPKLLRAGANDIVSPYKASGHAMARLALGERAHQVGQQPTVSAKR
jgi:voltage-gated potassium channel